MAVDKDKKKSMAMIIPDLKSFGTKPSDQRKINIFRINGLKS